jgi:hypothetical protein
LPDPLTGRIRQEWLDDAIARGDAYRVWAFFRGFTAAHGGEGRSSAGGARRARTASGQQQPIYTRDQIKQFYELHRKGKLTGPEWERTEQAIIAAANEGRVAGALEPTGR